MYIKRHYGFWMTFRWSKKSFILGLIYSGLVGFIHYWAPIQISLPWQPITILGIAVAFYLGFKNNSSYDRTWEARKIWGGIVNHSRTFANAVITMISNPDIQKQLIYRHIAWLTALRYQLRLSRTWEHTKERLNDLYMPTVCETYIAKLHQDLSQFIEKEEIKAVTSKSNAASQLLLNQSKEFQKLHDSGLLSDYKHVRMNELIGFLYDEQGKSERIKNFPFPRQYASTAIWLTMVFSALIPFGMLDIFAGKTALEWIFIPFSALVIWVFFLMEKIGDYSENPFEGTYNDVPISTISRSIEIDLREMINNENIPAALKDDNGFLM